MDTPNKSRELQQEPNEVSAKNGFDLAYQPDEDVNPLELLGNAYLALHHHMAPTDGGFDLEQGNDE
ncbi:MAG: hypothetical protein N2255_00520 [Kiritimatiellae bacterium]|jgi:hypothetical protein|nr:hypothetical protein [Kiritimatiellia bacterium]